MSVNVLSHPAHIEEKLKTKDTGSRFQGEDLDSSSGHHLETDIHLQT